MEAKVKLNPTRLRIPKYGNGLMLLMEYASKYQGDILGKVTNMEENFDVEIKATKAVAQSWKRYINANL